MKASTLHLIDRLQFSWLTVSIRHQRNPQLRTDIYHYSIFIHIQVNATHAPPIA